MPQLQNELYEWLKSRLPIDKLRLDDEFIELPQWQQQAAEAFAGAQAERDHLDHLYDVVEATAAYNLRYPQDPAVKQPSEATIKSELALSQELQDARSNRIEADRDVAEWRQLCDALRTKYNAMRAIADLMQQGYTSVTAVQTANRRGSISNRPPPPV